MDDAERKKKLDDFLDAIAQKQFNKKEGNKIKGDFDIVKKNLDSLKREVCLSEMVSNDDKKKVEFIGTSIDPMTGKFISLHTDKAISIGLNKHYREIIIPESTKEVIYTLSNRAKINFNETIRNFRSLYKETNFK